MTNGDPDRSERFLAGMAPVLVEAPAGTIGVAVSGGSDSLALLLLLERWAAREGRGMRVVTVDHGLRHGSAAEAQSVADLCRMRGLPHDTLKWQPNDLAGNLQALARMARRRLIGEWAAREGVVAVALGHTLDDQAETFLMRLARGSGVDGLAAMSGVSRGGGLVWLRPMLDLGRDELRTWLSDQGMCWAEDPSNSDLRFDRARMRAAQDALDRLGFTRARLAETARHMRRARAALEADTARLAAACATLSSCGEVTVDVAAFGEAAEEIRLRLLAALLSWIGNRDYRPRFDALTQLEAAITGGDLGSGRTLHGCVVRQRRGRVVIRREPARPGTAVPLGDRVWDGRWELRAASDDPGSLRMGALGREGLAQVGDWTAAGHPRESLLTTPAIWSGSRLVAAPLAGRPNGFRFRLRPLPDALSGMSQLD